MKHHTLYALDRVVDNVWSRFDFHTGLQRTNFVAFDAAVPFYDALVSNRRPVDMILMSVTVSPGLEVVDSPDAHPVKCAWQQHCDATPVPRQKLVDFSLSVAHAIRTIPGYAKTPFVFVDDYAVDDDSIGIRIPQLSERVRALGGVYIDSGRIARVYALGEALECMMDRSCVLPAVVPTLYR